MIIECGKNDSKFILALRHCLEGILVHKDAYENDARVFYDAVLALFVRVSKLVPSIESVLIVLNALPMTSSSPECLYVVEYVVNFIECNLKAIVTAVGRDRIVAMLSYHSRVEFLSTETKEKIDRLIGVIRIAHSPEE